MDPPRAVNLTAGDLPPDRRKQARLDEHLRRTLGTPPRAGIGLARARPRVPEDVSDLTLRSDEGPDPTWSLALTNIHAAHRAA
jgi:hypothetical protein